MTFTSNALNLDHSERENNDEIAQIVAPLRYLALSRHGRFA